MFVKLFLLHFLGKWETSNSAALAAVASAGSGQSDGKVSSYRRTGPKAALTLFLQRLYAY